MAKRSKKKLQFRAKEIVKADSIPVSDQSKASIQKLAAGMQSAKQLYENYMVGLIQGMKVPNGYSFDIRSMSFVKSPKKG